MDAEQLGAAIQVAPGRRSMYRQGGSIYMRVGDCVFKFAVLDNDNLLAGG